MRSALNPDIALGSTRMVRVGRLGWPMDVDEGIGAKGIVEDGVADDEGRGRLSERTS